MVGASSLIKAMLLLAASTFASTTYPPIPGELTTPVQQRLAVYGPNGRAIESTLKKANTKI